MSGVTYIIIAWALVGKNNNEENSDLKVNFIRPMFPFKNKQGV